MKRLLTLIAISVICAGCGELEEARQTANAFSELAEMGQNLAESNTEALMIIEERRANGDTTAMTTDRLKAYLPTAIDGYASSQELSLAQNDVGGVKATVAEQEWVAANSADTSNAARIKVTLMDWGNSVGGLTAHAPMAAFSVTQDDATRRASRVELDLPYTTGMQEFEKGSKDSRLSVITRYRFVITLDATNQTEDQTAKLMAIAATMAEKFRDM